MCSCSFYLMDEEAWVENAFISEAGQNENKEQERNAIFTKWLDTFSLAQPFSFKLNSILILPYIKICFNFLTSNFKRRAMFSPNIYNMHVIKSTIQFTHFLYYTLNYVTSYPP